MAEKIIVEKNIDLQVNTNPGIDLKVYELNQNTGGLVYEEQQMAAEAVNNGHHTHHWFRKK